MGASRPPKYHTDGTICAVGPCSVCDPVREHRRAVAARETESAIQQDVRLALSAAGAVVWRNNVGVDTSKGVRYGLAVGSADLIGIAPGGRFLSVEVKTRTGRVRPEQALWLELVRARGGIAIVARSAEDAVAQLRAALSAAENT